MSGRWWRCPVEAWQWGVGGEQAGHDAEFTSMRWRQLPLPSFRVWWATRSGLRRGDLEGGINRRRYGGHGF